MSALTAASFGGGVQSMAMLVLAATGRLDVPLFIFANVGDDSEHPDTTAYVREIAQPYADAHGVELVTVQRHRRNGVPETLMEVLNRGRRCIPMRRAKDGPPMSRSCTADSKIAPIGKELKRRGATKENPARVAIGISVDEIERAKPGIDPRSPHQERFYPLLDLGMHRSGCRRVITDAGLPVPPKSACFFCPFHDADAWRSLRRKRPDLFVQAVDLERRMSDASTDGRPVFLTRHGLPLDQTLNDQLSLDGMDGCDSGWCMT